jgi:tetratricopeptide (TPR) repeat protein
VRLAGQPAGAPKDPVVRAALERWGSPSPEGSERLAPERLRALDVLRDEDPGRAVREARAALAAADREQLPRLLAVYGSARRVQAELDKALDALHHALYLAEVAGDRALAADVLQRLGVAYAYRGDNSLGLLYAKEAGYRHRLAGDRRGEGRSWVDQGARYFHLGELDLAVAAFEQALEVLPQDEVRHRFSAHQCLAKLHHAQGELERALRHVGLAERLGPEVEPGLVGNLYWTKAEIAGEVPDYPLVERCFADALEMFRVASPVDAALAAVELVRAQILQGKHEAAFETTRGMVSLLQALHKNRIVSAALMRLIRAALEGRGLTERMLERAAGEIREERARRQRRARGRG